MCEVQGDVIVQLSRLTTPWVFVISLLLIIATLYRRFLQPLLCHCRKTWVFGIPPKSDELGGTTPNILSPPSRFHGHSAFSLADFSSVYEL
jgi:hypothetical protein